MGLFSLFIFRADVWSKIAREINGEYTPKRLFAKDSLTLKHREWLIKMDVFKRGSSDNKRTYTRLRAPFLHKTNFQFEIRRENVLSSAGKFFGMQDIEIGNHFFDEQFIIQSNDEHKIKDLLDDEELKNFISYQPKILLKVKHKAGSIFQKGYPEEVDELYFECRGIIKNEEVIIGLFAIFKTMLDRMVAVDLAYEGDPEFVPK